MSHKDIAAITAATANALSAIVHELRSHGVIEGRQATINMDLARKKMAEMPEINMTTYDVIHKAVVKRLREEIVWPK